MAQKFDPAPVDKHAADPKQAAKADKKMHSELDKGLEETFPASDPPSSTQPGASKSGSPSPKQHGISLDDKAQEQPTDKGRAQQVSRKDRGSDPPGQK